MNRFCALVLLGLVVVATSGKAVAADQAAVSIQNGTRATVVAIQVRPTQSKEPWTALVQREPLGFNGRVQGPKISGKCQQYDIQALFDDGHRVIKANQRMCLPGPYKITEY